MGRAALGTGGLLPVSQPMADGRSLWAGDRQPEGVAPFRERQTEGQRDRRGAAHALLRARL